MTVPVLVEIDHAAYLRERAYRRQVLIALRRLARSRSRGRLGTFQVLHEQDLACCRFEPWERTAQRIYSSLAADGVGVVHATVLGDEEEE